MSASKLKAKLTHHASAGLDSKGRELPANRMELTVNPSGKYSDKDGAELVKGILKMASDHEGLLVNRYNVFAPGKSELLPDGDWHELVPMIKEALRENRKPVLSFVWFKNKKGTKFPAPRLNLFDRDKGQSGTSNKVEGVTEY